MTKVAVIYYSTYGHVKTLALQEKKGLEAAGIEVDLLQIPETLSDDVLAAMHASKDSSVPYAVAKDLVNYDGILVGIPTRFGTFPAQFGAFWESAISLWMNSGLAGKYVGVFYSTSTPNGGVESTVRNTLSLFVHMSLNYVPLGYPPEIFGDITNLDEVHSGSPWGAGTFAGADGSRQPTELELKIAYVQGREFGHTVDTVFGKKTSSAAPTSLQAPPPSSSAPPPAAAPAPQKTTIAAPSKAPAATNEKDDKSTKCCIIM